MPTPASRRNSLFDALRGLAAVSVMLFHITNTERHPMLPGGYLAVDLFFLLSGFVLWNAYGPRLAEGSLAVGTFVRLRLVRLYPLFAIGLALGIVRAIGAMHLGDPRAPGAPMLLVEIASGALLIPTGFDRESLFPLDNPAWSLSLEVAVNVAFGIWMVRRPDRRLLALCLAAAIGLAIVALRYGSLDLGWRMANAIGGPLRCAFSFTLGMVMARRRRGAGAGPRNGPILPLSVLAGFVVLIGFAPGAALRPWFDLMCVFVAFPAILALAADAAMRGLPARIAAALGEMSYPLYATHYPLILPAMLLCRKLGLGGPAETIAIALACLVVAAALVPVDRAIRRRLRRRAQPGAPTTVLTSMKSARP